MRIKIALSALAALLLILLCGCQPTPESAIVVSKNDGALEAALEVTAQTPAQAPAEVTAAPREAEIYTESFTNTDGNITFDVELETPVAEAKLPVLRVTPKAIPAETARHVAEVLFGDAAFYEYSETRTRGELEELILSLRHLLADPSAMEARYGAMKDDAAAWIEAEIAGYEAEYAAAPASGEAVPCAWEFHPHDWYVKPGWAVPVINDPEEMGDTVSQYIIAETERDGLPYLFVVCNREAEDYRFHGIACQVYNNTTDRAVYASREPTQADMDKAGDEARALLDEMDLGDWVIDSCAATDLPPGNSWSIVVKACPVYNGVKAVHLQQMGYLDKYDAYASNYFFEEMTFTFGDEGRLVGFALQSPLEVVETVNDNVAVLSFEEVMEAAKSRLRMTALTSDPYALEQFYNMLMFYPAAAVTVHIDQAELGLVRTRIKDNAEDFYLLPAYVFRAYYEIFDKNGQLLADSREFFTLDAAETQELIVVNAVDGSVINTSLGY